MNLTVIPQIYDLNFTLADAIAAFTPEPLTAIAHYLPLTPRLTPSPASTWSIWAEILDNRKGSPPQFCYER